LSTIHARFSSSYSITYFYARPKTDPILSPFTDDVELKMLDVPPTAAFLILVTGILLLLIVMVALIVKCVTKLKKKEPPRATEEGLDGLHQRINRVRLDTHSWNHTSAVSYSLLSNPAPPSYTDTIQADQETQHQISQQTTSEQIINEQSSSEESTTNIEE
jgi:hypothetical protein